MSQDQKPARVRMVDGSGGKAAATAAGATPAVAAADASGTPPVAKGRGGLLPVALFMVGCLGGGVAVARFLP